MAGDSVEAVAEALNVTPRRVQQLAKEGLPKADRGNYDVDAALRWYVRYLQSAVERRQDPAGGGDMAELTREKTRLAAEQADKTALQNAEARGDLGRLSVWETELEKFLVEIRAALLRFGTKTAPLLHGDTNNRKRVIDREIAEILRGLAEYRPARRITRDKGADQDSGASPVTAAGPDSIGMGGQIPPPI